ncbi:hypothetical protein CYY_003555 [Polysphondylium violaceum]|uniref:Rho-GAP domain-containing protein n=1 Tax=Polysphondylium violaceum TaxID=133409 RepID=A0A8J4V043_9MYCE|nr:hypothetical protein CYY_003555 [Polysphondylium violaceum]
MSSFYKKPEKFEISTPTSFQHVAGSNKPPPLQSPPTLNKIPTPPVNNLSTPVSPKSNQLNNSTSGTVVVTGQLQTTGGVISGGSSSSSSSSSSSQNAKKGTKSAIVSSKLRRWFKQRPTRNSLYEKHILNAPYASSTLSSANIFRVIQILRKSNAIETEGLFRVNGNAEKLLHGNINTAGAGNGSNNNNNNNVNNHNIDSITGHHDLAGLLKLYLRESKFPLLPLELFESGIVPIKIDDIKDFIVTKLPTENLHVLSYLLEYLEEVANNSHINKMNPIALGVCFAPNIIRSVSNSNNPQFQVQMTNIQNHCNFITSLIENRKYIFNQSEIPDLNNFELPPAPDQDDLNDDNYLPPPPDHGENIDDEDYDQEHQHQTNESHSTGNQDPATPISPLYDEFINLLTDDSLGASQKSIIINRMTSLFSTDSDNFKQFLREMGVDGIISLLEYILTLDDQQP